MSEVIVLGNMISTKVFAEKWGCTLDTVRIWCRKGLITGAEQDSKGSPWRIPEDALPPENYLKKIKQPV